MSFEDPDVVRSAIRVEGFTDHEFDYQLVRALGLAAYGGSAVGECLAAAAEISDGRPSTWTAAFERRARLVEDRGRACLDAGHRVSARDHLFRASTYYRTAEYYAAPGSDASPAPAEGDLGWHAQRCFADAAALAHPPVRRLEIPFGGGTLPGWLVVPPDAAGRPRPVVVGVGGFDSSAEELYFQLAVAGVARGWAVFVFDGPGQPACLRADPSATFRPDYEAPIGAVIDVLAGEASLDLERLAVAGLGFGAYFATRAAAADARVAALVVDPPVVDLGRYFEAWVGPEIFNMRRDVRPADVIGVPEDLLPRQMQWGIAAICRRFGVPSFHAWRRALEAYRVEDLGAVRCPALAVVGQREGAEPRRQFDAFVHGAGGPVTATVLGESDGVFAHAQADNLPVSTQVIYDWLDGQTR
jgi:hypothetical protein